METLVLTTLAMESAALQNVKFWSTLYSVVCPINVVLIQKTCTWHLTYVPFYMVICI